MNNQLKKFAKMKYSKSGLDLSSMFAELGLKMVNSGGFVGLIMPYVWMFLSTYQSFRNELLNNSNLTSLIQLEYNAFEPACVPVATFTLRKMDLPQFKGTFIKLSEFKGHQNQAPRTLEAIRTPHCKWKHISSVNNLKKLPGSPIAYWTSENVQSLFEKYSNFSENADACQGLSTANNDLFLRQWFEVSIDKASLFKNDPLKKWYVFNKGGGVRKWYGNLTNVINWENNGELLKSKRPKSVIRNPSYYFKHGVTWSDITSSYFSARYLPEGCVFGDVGPSVFFKNDNDMYMSLGQLNSKITDYLSKIINPSFHFQVGAFGKLPYIEIKGFNSLIIKEAIQIAKQDWNYFETSIEFHAHPLLYLSLKTSLIEKSFDNWKRHCESQISRMIEIESENNRLFIEASNLTNEMDSNVQEEEITLYRPDYEDDIKSLLSYAIGCMMGRYSLDHPGLIYAHSGNIDFDQSKYKTFPADDDGIIPIMDMDWFPDDATNRFVDFLKVAWSSETLDENLKFVADSLKPKRNETPSKPFEDT